MLTWCSSAVLQLPVLLRCFAHTLQPAAPASPARCPVRVRLWRVLLGQRPSLHNLRRRLPAFVRLLRRYYAAVRLPTAVHGGLMAHRLLLPARSLPAGGDGVSRFSRMEFLCMLLWSSTPQDRDTLALARTAVLPSVWADNVGIPYSLFISELNTQP